MCVCVHRGPGQAVVCGRQGHERKKTRNLGTLTDSKTCTQQLGYSQHIPTTPVPPGSGVFRSARLSKLFSQVATVLGADVHARSPLHFWGHPKSANLYLLVLWSSGCAAADWAWLFNWSSHERAPPNQG